jgi:hypothetical protein
MKEVFSMSKAFDLLSESLNDAILDTQTKHLPRHKGKIDIKPSGPSRKLLGLIASKKSSIQKSPVSKGITQPLKQVIFPYIQTGSAYSGMAMARVFT